MKEHIPGLADRIRNETIRRIKLKKYEPKFGNLRVERTIAEMSDATVISLSPVSLDHLAETYPKASDDWKRWDLYRQDVDRVVSTQAMSQWCEKVMEFAFVHGTHRSAA